MTSQRGSSCTSLQSLITWTHLQSPLQHVQSTCMAAVLLCALQSSSWLCVWCCAAYCAACTTLSLKVHPDLKRLVKPLRLGLATIASDAEAGLSAGPEMGCDNASGCCDAELALLLALLSKESSIGMRLPLLHTTNRRVCMLHRVLKHVKHDPCGVQTITYAFGMSSSHLCYAFPA